MKPLSKVAHEFWSILGFWGEAIRIIWEMVGARGPHKHVQLRNHDHQDNISFLGSGIPTESIVPTLPFFWLALDDLLLLPFFLFKRLLKRGLLWGQQAEGRRSTGGGRGIGQMGTSSFRNDGLDLWLKRPQQLFPSWVGKIKRRRSSYVTHPEEEFFMSKLGTGGSRPSRERGNISHRKGFSRTNHRLQSGFLKVGDICDRSREGYFLFLSVFFWGLKLNHILFVKSIFD